MNEQKEVISKPAIFIDETIIIYATRSNDYSSMSEVALVFFESNTYELHSSNITKARLGFGFFFSLWFKFKRGYLRLDAEHNSHDRKRTERCIMLSYHVRHFHSVWFPYRKYLIKMLFNKVNELKAKKLERQLKPEEVIPFDLCINAYLAYMQNMRLVSFNMDYQYFASNLIGQSKFLDFIPAPTFIKYTSARAWKKV